MSFIQHDALNTLYQPGWFLASGDCKRETCEVAQNHSQVVTKADGSKYVPAGAYISGKGLLYEDVDVSTGNMPGSVVTDGVVYEDRLPASYDSTVKNAIPGSKFIAAAPSIVRPLFDGSLASLTVASEAGTASGDTKITVSEYTPKTGESYKYKVGDTAAAVAYGDNLSDWTTWNGSADITAASGKKIVVAVINSDSQAVAAGSATVTAHA